MAEEYKGLYASKDSKIVGARRCKWIRFTKIHKQQTPVPGRPIVSSVSCPTSQIAKFLDAILSPLVEQQPTYIKDSNHAIIIFSTFRFQGEHYFLFSMDVKSLYTSIPYKDGLIALRHFLDQRPDPD